MEVGEEAKEYLAGLDPNDNMNARTKTIVMNGHENDETFKVTSISEGSDLRQNINTGQC